MPMKKTLACNIDPKDAIIISENHGGFTAGFCCLCKSVGWIDGLGYPSHAKKAPSNRLKHKHSCPMNQILSTDGSLKKTKIK